MELTKIIALSKKQQISNNVRLYLISKNKHYFINNGTLKDGFPSKLLVSKNRDSVLSAFSKMTIFYVFI